MTSIHQNDGDLIYWKVLTPLRYSVSASRHEWLGVFYPENIWTLPGIKHTRLLVFDSEDRARNFEADERGPSNRKLLVVRCVVKNPKPADVVLNPFGGLYAEDYVTFWYNDEAWRLGARPGENSVYAPMGTVACDAVKCLE